MKRSIYTPIFAYFFGFILLYCLIINTNKIEKKENTEKLNVKISAINPKNIIRHTLDDSVSLIPSSNDSPFLKISTEKDLNVKLNKLKINSKIVGSMATTTMEMEFYNELNRNLEAELNFPLADGQTITHFEMEVDGKMRTGVAVEKEKARVAFETTIRQNIDPGLIEMTNGNNFKARVFPVPAKGTKRIIVQYTEELTSSNNQIYYYLPLNYKDKLQSFDLKIDVLDQNLAPSLFQTNSNSMKFQKIESKFVAFLHKNDEFINVPLRIKISQPVNQPKTSVAISNKSTYFYSSLTVPSISLKKDKVKSVTVLWDVSNSREKSNKQVELDFLKKYLKHLKNTTVEIIPFANELLPSSFVLIKNGKTDQLEKIINGFVYDGGTTLTEITFNDCKGEEILLFSDGLSNLGKGITKECKKRIYTITSSSEADPSFLQSISLKTNGEFIDLTTENGTNAFQKIIEDQLHFIGFASNENIVEYYPRKATPKNGFLAITGKLKTNKTTLKALFGFGNQVYITETIPLSKVKLNSEAKYNMEKMCAIKKLHHLNLNYKVNKKQITALGIQYKLVTKNTSLLVLDRIEDYITHHIVPPLEMQKEYFLSVNREIKNDKKEHKIHLNQVYSTFKNQEKWWNKKIIKEKKRKVESITMNERSDNPQIANPNSPPPPIERTVAFAPPTVSDEVINGSDVVVSANTLTQSFSANSTVSSADGLYTTSHFDLSGTSNNFSTTNKGSISIQGWDPKSPYLSKIKNVNTAIAYSNYIQMKKTYGNQPSFFLDVADYFFAKNEKKIGIRILTNIAELELENHGLLRILAHKLLQLKENKIAMPLFEELVELRNEEPQSHRDLGLAYAENGEYQKAIEKLYYVVTETFDNRFNGIQLIALNEINNILAKRRGTLITDFMDKRFIKKMPVDIRVVLNWDADNTDVDLWVIDPRGEKCYYGHKETKAGGRISNDFTQGCGPEEFMIRNAIPGKYTVKANYYGSSSQSIQGKATLTVQFFKQFGTSEEKKEEITRRLNVTKEVLDLGSFKF